MWKRCKLSRPQSLVPPRKLACQPVMEPSVRLFYHVSSTSSYVVVWEAVSWQGSPDPGRVSSWAHCFMRGTSPLLSGASIPSTDGHVSFDLTHLRVAPVLVSRIDNSDR